MVRNYVRRSDRGTYPKEALAAAARDRANGMSIRRAIAENQVPYRTLARYVPIFQTHDDIESISIGYKKNRQVLPTAVENDLTSYCIKAAQIFHGITIKKLEGTCISSSGGQSLPKYSPKLVER